MEKKNQSLIISFAKEWYETINQAADISRDAISLLTGSGFDHFLNKGQDISPELAELAGEIKNLVKQDIIGLEKTLITAEGLMKRLGAVIEEEVNLGAEQTEKLWNECYKLEIYSCHNLRLKLKEYRTLLGKSLLESTQ